MPFGRLTTRWSGPGQLGAIVRRSVGRAAQLATVSGREIFGEKGYGEWAAGTLMCSA